MEVLSETHAVRLLHILKYRGFAMESRIAAIKSCSKGGADFHTAPHIHDFGSANLMRGYLISLVSIEFRELYMGQLHPLWYHVVMMTQILSIAVVKHVTSRHSLNKFVELWLDADLCACMREDIS